MTGNRMAKTEAPVSDTGGEAPDRFRYIGFEVFPKRIPKFWKSDEEERQYSGRVKLGAAESSLDRDSSLLKQEALGRIDRWALMGIGILMVATLVMPWVHYKAVGGGAVSMGWLGALGTLLGGLGNAFGGGFNIGLSALLALVVMLGGPALGVWILTALWGKATSADAYQARLRRPLRLGYIVFFAGVFVWLLALPGGSIPGYESWGLMNPGEGYGLGTLAAIVSFGAWVAIGLGWVAAVKAGDL